ncbi:MAG: alpha-ketoglutarate-dependent dioxygenase AlkB [Bacteroidota bacterium]|nr:alpha-ketoglutarate-dependent dioxygenase AlkB [Bacteroidota bacterium]
MDLFNNDRVSNILPHDGVVNYCGKIFSREKADHYYETLLNNIAWKNDEAVIFGKHFITARKVAWYADNGFPYTYSGTTKQSLPWTNKLLELKKIAEEKTEHSFNSCLLNLYHNGDEGMAYHSDDEKSLGGVTVIASLSFGAERKFLFKHKRTKESVSLILEHGSLLVMKGETQLNWMHRLPPTTKVKRPRINLTFRTIIA